MTLVLNDFESAAVQDGLTNVVFRLNPKAEEGSRIYSGGKSYEVLNVRFCTWHEACNAIEACGISEREAAEILASQAILSKSPQIYRHELDIGLPDAEEEEIWRDYLVTLSLTGTATVVVRARDQDEAGDIAKECSLSELTKEWDCEYCIVDVDAIAGTEGAEE